MNRAISIFCLATLLSGCQTLTVSSPSYCSCRYLGIAPLSTVNTLPECGKDCAEASSFFASLGWETQVVSGLVVPIADARRACEWLHGSDVAVVHFSGHGWADSGKYFLWCGDWSNVWAWDDFVATALAPACASCGEATVVLDTCFAGKALTSPGTSGKTSHRVKSLGTDLDAAPDATPADDVRVRSIRNLCVICATGPRDFADGAFVPSIEAHYALDAFGTCGMSLFSYCWVSQLYYMYWMEHVARSNANYFRSSNTWCTLQQVFSATDNMQVGAVMHQSSPRWISLAPATSPHAPRMWKGAKHSGFMFRYFNRRHEKNIVSTICSTGQAAGYKFEAIP